MKKFAILFLSLSFLIGCGDKKEKDQDQVAVPYENTEGQGPESYDPKRGEGPYDKVDLDPTLNHALADKGEAASGVKCLSCHKTTDERLVGPGWAGVTERRTPQWIMNFITNPDPMIDKDPEVQAQLELCLVRMPNQNLADEEARAILEYMRELDGVK
ncbi:MAG: cytochrome c [Flavobacterium sp.]|nr:cytochrome c [Flavobacterium sp.]